MGQIAYHATTGERVEAFSVSEMIWQDICDAAQGVWLMPRTAWPAVPKTSIRGLRFFAHYPDFPGQLPAPESYAHTRLKIDVVNTLRMLGYRADLEVSGTDGVGGDWIADVLVNLPDAGKAAFEIQLSGQHLDDFRKRTERYSRSGITVCWIMSERPVALRLTKALCHLNIQYYRKNGVFLADCDDILPLTIDLNDKNSYPDSLPLVRFGRGLNQRKMPLAEAVAGVLKGYPRWVEPDWCWHPAGDS